MKFGQAIAGFAAQTPDKIAIISTTQGALTYAQLTRQIASLGASLRDAGLTDLSRVAVLLDHSLEAAIVQLGVANACIAVPLDPAYTEREFLAATEMYDVDGLVVGAGAEALGAKLASARDIPLFRAPPAEAPTPNVTLELLDPGGPHRRLRPGDQGFAFLLSSSGTTGKPKIIPVTHENVLALPINMKRIFEVTPEDRSVCSLPIYYSAGLGQCLLSPLVMGGSVAIPAKSAREDVQGWLPQLKPTWLTSSPATLRRVLDRLSPDQDAALPGVRFVICGASLVPEPLRQEAEARLGVPVLETYGSTESGVLTANPVPPRRRKFGTVGVAPPDLVAVLGPDGERLAPGEVGEVGIRGPHVTPGYIGLPAPADGWLRIGDLGSIDEDGFLTIVGRAKEMINRGGAKVSPYDVEAAALEHPAIAECAAFGAPHPRLGEAVALAVVFRPGQSATPAELKAFLAERLAGFKIPQSIAVRDTLPRGPTGKIVRERLAAAFEAEESPPPTAPTDILGHQILAVWQRLLRRTDIGIDDDFFEAGGDSLMGQEMLLEVEALVRRKIPEGRITYPITIRSLHAVVGADLGEDEGAQRVTRATEGEGEPFFFCHGDYVSRGLYALKLAEAMKLDRPVYLIHTGYTREDRRPIEAIAAAIVPEMIRIQPTGPFVLGGYCNGGLLAWELAHQLERAGREVRRTLLVEPMSLNARPGLRAASRAVAALAALTAGRIDASRQMTRLWRLRVWRPSAGTLMTLAARKLAPSRQSAIEPTEPATEPSVDEVMTEKVFSIMANYVPPKLAGDIHCFTATDGEDRDQFDPAPWRARARTLRISSVPGDHLGCVTLHLDALAREMRSVLA